MNKKELPEKCRDKEPVKREAARSYAVLVPVDVLQRIARDAESLADELTGRSEERRVGKECC